VRGQRHRGDCTYVRTTPAELGVPLASPHAAAVANTRPPSLSLSLEQAVQSFQEAQDAEGFTRKTQVSYAKVLVLLVRYLRTTPKSRRSPRSPPSTCVSG
jgi:hypothetical protein